MQMIILPLEKHISDSQHHHNRNQIHPMRTHGIRNRINKYQRYHQLQAHVEQRYLHMSYLQFIRHQLERMLAMRFSQVLVQHDTMNDGQTAIDAIHHQQQQVRHILRPNNQFTQNEQQDKSNTDAAHIPGKAFRIPFRSKVEEAEHQHTQHTHHDERILHIPLLLVDEPQRKQHHQRITGCNPIDTIHEINDVGSPHTYDERKNNHPPHIKMQDIQLIKHQPHRSKLHQQTNAIRQ